MSDEKRIDEDDTEGQGGKWPVANQEGDLPDDTEGQRKIVANEESDLEDDAEGHQVTKRK